MGWRGRQKSARLTGVYEISIILEGIEYVYIGESVDIMNRWISHVTDLVCGTHHATRLQAAYDSVDVTQVRFRVLEIVGLPGKVLKPGLRSAERKWINKVPSNRLLNGRGK